MAQKLTKEMLTSWGIEVEKDDTSKYGYKVYRTWQKTRAKSKSDRRELKIVEFTCKHKYSADIKYPGVGFSVACKAHPISLSRLVYAYFVGDIEDGYEIDHINNNRFDNSLDNLQKLTKTENLIKRYSDNGYYGNQYKFKK